MVNFLNQDYFSVEYFNDEGLSEVSYLTNIDYEELVFEIQIGNYMIGQLELGTFYIFCDSIRGQEITYNKFKDRLAKR